VFVGLSVVTLVVALAIWWRVPDIAKPAQSGGIKAQFAAVRTVVVHSRFWWIAPLAGFTMGSFMAIQGLWSVPWLMEVDGYSRMVAADHLLVLGIVILGGYLGLSFFATTLRRFGIGARHLLAAGFGLNILMLALIVTQALSSTYVAWALYGLGSAVNVLGFTVLGEGFPPELAARANTALNLLMFTSSFATQWGIGIVVDVAQGALGIDVAGALRLAFALVFAADVLALAWFALGWRRYAVAAPPGRVVA